MSRFNTNPLVPHLIQGGHGYAYNLDIGLRKWRAALAKIKSGTALIANLNILGDSHGEGTGSDVTPANWLTKGFVGRLRTRLATLYGDVGTGFIPIFYPYGAPFWTLNAGWSVDTSYQVGITKQCALGASGTGTMTFSFTGTGLEILWAGGPSLGRFNWKIDAGADTLVDTYMAEGAIGVTTISELSATTHTLTITRIADEKVVIIFGAYPTNANTAGVRVNNMSRYGTLSADFLGDVTFVTDLEIGYFAPVLTVIALISNDAMASTPIATYISQIQSLVTIAKASGDVLLLNSGGTPAIATSALKPYGDALKSLAISNGIAYVDHATRLGDSSTLAALGLIAADNTHWSAAGHQDAATALLNTLLEER